MRAPLLIVDGPAERLEAVDDLAELGWRVAPGWHPPIDPRGAVLTGVVLTGTVTNAEEIGPVVLAAISGAGIVAELVGTDRRLGERLCDDLRRLGPVVHRAAPGWSGLPREERVLLDLLGGGLSLGEAAARLHVGRRTADRRLASARQRLGAASTGEAVRVRRERRAALPSPG